jgi:hypothetical protein
MLMIFFVIMLSAVVGPSIAEAREQKTAQLFTPRPDIPIPRSLLKIDSYGGCGKQCRTTSGNIWSCGSKERPYFDNNGGCRWINMESQDPRC